MAAIWTTQPERGHPALLRGFVRFALTVGRPIARLLLHPIVLYFVVAGGAARAASRDYLKRALGRESTIVDGYKHVHAFASALLDRMFLLNDRHDAFRVTVTGDEVMKHAMGGRTTVDGQVRRGAFVIGAHFGSFEVARSGGRHEEDLRVSMVMYEENARFFAEIAAAINPKLSSMIIPLGHVDSMLRVKRALDDGGVIGMLADRTLAEAEGTAGVRRMTLLGGTVSIPTGPFRMAAMMRRPAIFIVGIYRGGNRYDVHYEEIEDFSLLDAVPPGGRAEALAAATDRAIARYVERLEFYCRDAPYNWFNFYDYWNDAAVPGTHASARRSDRGPRT